MPLLTGRRCGSTQTGCTQTSPPRRITPSPHAGLQPGGHRPARRAGRLGLITAPWADGLLRGTPVRCAETDGGQNSGLGALCLPLHALELPWLTEKTLIEISTPPSHHTFYFLPLFLS